MFTPQRVGGPATSLRHSSCYRLLPASWRQDHPSALRVPRPSPHTHEGESTERAGDAAYATRDVVLDQATGSDARTMPRVPRHGRHDAVCCHPLLRRAAVSRHFILRLSCLVIVSFVSLPPSVCCLFRVPLFFSLSFCVVACAALSCFVQAGALIFSSASSFRLGPSPPRCLANSTRSAARSALWSPRCAASSSPFAARRAPRPPPCGRYASGRGGRHRHHRREGRPTGQTAGYVAAATSASGEGERVGAGGCRPGW